MSRVEVIGNATLYLGDCRDLLPSLSADHVITDPPYGARAHSMARTSKRETARSKYRQGASRFIDFQFLPDDDFVDITKLCMGSAKRWTVMTCDHRHAALTFDWPEHIRLGAWVKIAPMPCLSGDRPGSGHESVLILHGSGQKRWNRGGGAAIWRMAPMKSATEVATQKPIALAEAFVSDFTDSGETVLDPFAGSGTVGIACSNLGRKYIGIERAPRHFDVACRRIEDAQRQGRLIA